MLENGELPVLLLLLSFVVQPQNRFVHDAGEEEDLVNLFLLGDSAEFIMLAFPTSESRLCLCGFPIHPS